MTEREHLISFTGLPPHNIKDKAACMTEMYSLESGGQTKVWAGLIPSEGYEGRIRSRPSAYVGGCLYIHMAFFRMHVCLQVSPFL